MSSASKDGNRIYSVEKNIQVTIDLDDGLKLAATTWIPRRIQTKEIDEQREEEKFVTILEYLPYRKADWTSRRDELRLSRLSLSGYVSLRVDRRGTGNSQGFFDDEYSPQELQDGLQIIKWIEQQHWANGKVVLFGKSWSGFNALQLAFLDNQKIAGVISAYSTDDRYSDDIHYVGGCLAAQEALSWSSQMLLWLSVPPHPLDHGGIGIEEDRMDIWMKRLNHLEPLDRHWMNHQTRDDYWRHGSIGEDYSRLRCPVLLIGGFADLYTDPVLRMLDQLSCPRRAILGPWGHQYPDKAFPGPQIGFVEEVLEWLDYHTKGISNGEEKKSLVSVYELCPNVGELHLCLPKREGRWLDLNEVPSTPSEYFQRNGRKGKEKEKEKEKEERREGECVEYSLWGERLSRETLGEVSSRSFHSVEETGMSSGNLLGWGSSLAVNLPPDQSADDGRSLIFQSSPLTESLHLFGFPLLNVLLSSSGSTGLLCARLCLVDEKSNRSILLSRGILNLTHRESHSTPQLLEPNQIYQIEVQLSSLCVDLPGGSCLRLSLSSSYWPLVWPSSQSSRLTVHFSGARHCFLRLPCLPGGHVVRDGFVCPSLVEGLRVKELRECSLSRRRVIDELEERTELQLLEDVGCVEYPDGCRWDERSSHSFSINSLDPQSGRIFIERDLIYSFSGEIDLEVEIHLKSSMWTLSSPSSFVVEHQLKIDKEKKQVFQRTWHLTFPRLYN